MADRAAFHAVIRGRVQMVGFRFFAVRVAEEWGVAGWVRNRRDGAVEVEAVGRREALDDFLDELRRGPPSARVTAVDLQWLDEIPEVHGFSVEHSF
jgi:acylphosphatase